MSLACALAICRSSLVMRMPYPLKMTFKLAFPFIAHSGDQLIQSPIILQRQVRRDAGVQVSIHGMRSQLKPHKYVLDFRSREPRSVEEIVLRALNDLSGIVERSKLLESVLRSNSQRSAQRLAHRHIDVAVAIPIEEWNRWPLRSAIHEKNQ